jgi:predicted PhzF superfamily epimerase YddE/YHI9
MTRSGELAVTRGPKDAAERGNVMSLPSAPSEPFASPAGFADALGRSFNSTAPQELFISAKGGAGAKALIAVWDTPGLVKSLAPAPDLKDVAMRVGAGSVLATAPGGGTPYDMVSRFFAPYYGVPEDPVTGSAHCAQAVGQEDPEGAAGLGARRRSSMHRRRRTHHHPRRLRLVSDGRN